MTHPSKKSAIALWHRYGPGGHTACGGHAIPLVVEELAKTYEVHYFGMHSVEPTPPRIAANARLHLLPFTFHRASTHDKLVKTLIWYAAMPFMALYCRFKGVKLIFVDETLPLLAPIVIMFYGRSLAITIMDFFLDIYFEEARLMRPLIRLIKAWDVWAWRRIPVIFTKVDYTHQYLTKVGVPADRIHTIRNPCDFSIFHPMDKAAARLRFGIPQDDLVMVHHGILHPNKNNDLPIRALAELRADVPNLRFLLIGDGPEMPRLKALAAELGVTDRVTFTGWLPDEATLNEALNTADIGLVLRIGQYWDNFHMTETLAHEMAVGLPILASDLKGIAEVVVGHGRNGFLFAAGNLSELTDRLRDLAGDAQARHRLRSNALDTAQRCCEITGIAGRMCMHLQAAAELRQSLHRF